MVKKFVSIVTPSFNSAKYIEKTVHSVLGQTHENWELIIVDDASTDNSVEIIKQLIIKDNRVKLIQFHSNKGAAKARNAAIDNASGEFIAFLDSDDVWHPNKLECQLDFMGNNIDFSFTAYELIDELDRLLGKQVDADQVGSFNYQDMLKKKATLGCSTVIVRQSGFSDISMPLLRTGQDYALWLKLLKTGKQAHVLNKVMGQYRILPNSISRNKFKKALRQWEIYREVEKLPFFQTTVCFFFYALRAVFRK
jgi:teichuronic acid biosynthesis glycosyltransferase TuaG